MKVNIFPKTNLGKWSLLFIIAMPVLFFFGTSLTNTLYNSTPAGNTMIGDIIQRPALSISMLAGIGFGIVAPIIGTIAIIRNHERSLLVYISTIIGTLLILFLIGEIIFPH